MLLQIKSLSVLCIPNYPDHNLPTIFVYHNGALKSQLIGPSSFPQSLKQDGKLSFVSSNEYINSKTICYLLYVSREDAKFVLCNFPCLILELEWMLSETGAIKSELEEDPRPKTRDALFSQLGVSSSSQKKHNRTNDDSDNDDW